MGFEQTPAVSPETDYKPHPSSAQRKREAEREGEESIGFDGERLYLDSYQHQKVILVIIISSQ